MKTLNIFLISILFILEIILVKSKTISVKESENVQKNDDYYLVIVNNTLSSSMLKKRNEKLYNLEDDNINFELLISDEINNLIVENKNTYKNITAFEEIDNKKSNFEKRNKDVEFVRDYGNSKHIYPIGSYKERTVLLAYLSSKLVKIVESLSYVISCDKDMKFKPAQYYDKNEILKETKWEDLSVRSNAPFHLSLISQGKFDNNLVSQYDTNYYYPSSAGEGIDIYIMDMSLNVKGQEEFINNKTNSNRIVENKFSIVNGMAYYGDYKHEYDISVPEDFISHGTNVAIMAGGNTFGVANKANIRAIHFDDFSASNLYSTLMTLIHDKTFDPRKSVFNMSFSNNCTVDYLKEESTKLFQEMVNDLSNKGSIFVASAGNDGINVHRNNPDNNNQEEYIFPCCYDNVICVGGISSRYNLDLNKGYTLAVKSNYGNEVDIYAPFFTETTYKTTFGKNFTNKSIYGTSFSAPLVSGVIATILGEDKNTNYTGTTMLEKLRNMGEKGYITTISGDKNKNKINKNDASNVFLNNGKRTVYSKDNLYNGCGVHAGNRNCSTNMCCSNEGKCVSKNNNVCSIKN